MGKNSIRNGARTGYSCAKDLGLNLQELGLGKAYLDRTPKAQLKDRDVRPPSRLKMFVFKGHHQPTECEKIFPNDKSDKGHVSRIHKLLPTTQQ